MVRTVVIAFVSVAAIVTVDVVVVVVVDFVWTVSGLCRQSANTDIWSLILRFSIHT